LSMGEKTKLQNGCGLSWYIETKIPNLKIPNLKC
jgi:hypothetical protein